MQISYNWLKQYLDLELTHDKVAELLTGCGLEVEGIERYQSVKGGLEGVVIAEVVDCVKHPNSDHLSKTLVNTGSGEPLHVVCGASNVAAGQKVALATVGTTLYIGDKVVTLQKTKIRGEVSEGMICAEDELGLGESHDGILVLPPDAPVGCPASVYFGIVEDWVFSIGLTPNRIDAASHTGVARDLAAVLNNMGKNGENSSSHHSLRLPETGSLKGDSGSKGIAVTIEKPEACPRYCGVTIEGIRVTSSPDWLRHKLEAVGLRPINNIVDVTNFVMFELGQPLHAFDGDQVNGGQVVVKGCSPGTRFTTLDGNVRELDPEDLMICNADEPMCIAGVFGGIKSGVTPETTRIFLESACFDARHVRRTSRRHGLQTDASFRFERGVDPEITMVALKRAASLILEVAGGIILGDFLDVNPIPFQPRIITLTFANLDRLVGKVLDRTTTQNILADLGFTLLENNDPRSECSDPAKGFSVVVPGFKVDVTREADLIEEVLRIFGYNNVEISGTVTASLSTSLKPDPGKVQNVVADLLSSNGFHEIMNNSLTRSAYYENSTDLPVSECVRLLNPISRDLDLMRPSLLYGGLEAIAYNQNRRISDLRLYEFGTVYRLDPSGAVKEPVPGYHEERHLALWATGNVYPENWNNPEKAVDLFLVKAYVEGILERLSVGPVKTRVAPSDLLPERLCYVVNEVELAWIGEVSPILLKQFDIRSKVFYAQLDWDQLLKRIPRQDAKFHELPKFPEVRRDLALLVTRDTTFSQIEAVAFETERKLLKKVGLFDVYEGDKIDAGYSSYAVSFILRDEMRTLTEKDIEKVMERLVRAFAEKLNAQIR